MRTATRVLVCMALMLIATIGGAMAQDPASPMVGTWTGNVQQNSGDWQFTVIMSVTANGGETNYPEIDCGGILKRVGSANGYVFFTETITRGRVETGGKCVDGTLTIASNGEGLSWGSVGTYGGKDFVAWGGLGRKKDDPAKGDNLTESLSRQVVALFARGWSARPHVRR